MATAAPSTVVESKSKTILEASLFVTPVGIGLVVPLVFLSEELGSGRALELAAGGMMAGAVLVGVALGLAVPFALYFDAREIGRQDFEWKPTGILYAIGSLFLSGLVVLHYLWKRYKYTADAETRDWWWYAVAGYLVAVVVGVGLLSAEFSTVAMVLLVPASGFASVALYKDAAHVRTENCDWLPNPIDYYLGFVFGHVLVIAPPVIAGYYLFKRYRSVGLQ